MARARNIKPDFFKNDELAECPALARLLFAALWCMADREGRLEDRPKKIKIEALPFDECDCDQLLQILHDKKFIVRYQVGGRRLIQVVNFKKHQNPHIKENPSDIPPPVEENTPSDSNTKQARCATVTCTSVTGLIPDSLNLIPDSPSPQTDSRALRSSESKATRQIKSEGEYSQGFDAFWSAYGKKLGIGSARDAWAHAVLKEPNETKIIQAAINQTAIYVECGKNAGDMKQADRWLAGEHWKDPLDDLRKTLSRNTTKGATNAGIPSTSTRYRG